MFLLGLWVKWEGGEAMRYDLLVIGNGPDAVRSAIEGAKRGQRVALVHSSNDCSGRIMSGMLRQAAVRLSKCVVMNNEPVLMSDLRREVACEVQSELAADQAELARVGVDVFTGDVRFIDARTIAVGTELLACGSITSRIKSA